MFNLLIKKKKKKSILCVYIFFSVIRLFLNRRRKWKINLIETVQNEYFNCKPGLEVNCEKRYRVLTPDETSRKSTAISWNRETLISNWIATRFLTIPNILYTFSRAVGYKSPRNYHRAKRAPKFITFIARSKRTAIFKFSNLAKKRVLYVISVSTVITVPNLERFICEIRPVSVNTALACSVKTENGVYCSENEKKKNMLNLYKIHP